MRVEKKTGRVAYPEGDEKENNNEIARLQQKNNDLEKILKEMVNKN